MYYKTGGKNGKHAATTKSDNISALSHLVVQVFEHMNGSLFCIFPSMTDRFQTKGWAIIPPTSFLCCLTGSNIALNGMGIKISNNDFETFQKLKGGIKAFNEVAKSFRKRKPKGTDDLEES
ncbi:hypothetical protein C8J56DRAFT_801893 [Mycena floridula]|nr:hypothetical protein C8J56DRAFT_801893 [Mycena floridula]